MIQGFTSSAGGQLGQAKFGTTVSLKHLVTFSSTLSHLGSTMTPFGGGAQQGGFAASQPTNGTGALKYTLTTAGERGTADAAYNYVSISHMKQYATKSHEV